MRDNNRPRTPRNFDSPDRDSDYSPEVSSLAKQEQEHRHAIQDRYLSTFRIGQLCGFFYNLALLYLIYDLVNNGEKLLALQIFALNAAIIAFVIITFLIEKRLSFRRFSNKKGPNRRYDNRNNDNRNKKPVR